MDVFSCKDHFTKLPNGDEYYSVTIAYFTREILDEAIRLDSSETLDAGFFPLHELPEGTSPLIQKIIPTILLHRE